MGKKEHIFQAVLFEAILVALSTIAVMFLAHREVGETGALFVMISLLALLWNVVSNWLFDQKFSAPRETRTFAIRALHAVLFEGAYCWQLYR
ncbi:chlorhexidine efflux transporter [Kingella negevensis]|uniref:chlorhexidine efflux transporter n=1 Tax=Kingella negevensis TaxID=1522312 RepID=UPI002542D9D0|nr:chlorhexidine efflux transporter [Kingella negevensis]WII93429.1 chlorhexidine efflux transporter [Kingella negevensis]